MSFAALGLAEPILRAAAAEGYTVPTPIQTQAVPHVLAGRDMLGCAQTGTGKTAAFAWPILHRLGQVRPTGQRHVRALVLSPTRELAAQIGESFAAYGRHMGLRHTVIFGGVGQGSQERAMRAGVDIVVATPGRLMDLMGQGIVRLDRVEVFVLDEADRMLDMGFIHDIRDIAAKLPTKRQTLLFSATMPAEIRRLAGSLLNKPVEISVDPVATPAELVEQCVYHVARADKPALLRHLLQSGPMSRTLVFTRTKRGADRVVKQLRAAGVRAESIHGNKSQNARERAMLSFKSQRPPVLVATDIASRGIDIDEISHVVNYEIPLEPESYVHRIGRTGRAGASGIAVSFCDSEERPRLRDIERLMRRSIPVRNDVPQFKAPAAGLVAPEPARDHAHPHARQATQPRPHGQHAQHAPHAAGHKPHSGGADHGHATVHRAGSAARPAAKPQRSSGPHMAAGAPGRGAGPSWPKRQRRGGGKQRRF